MSDNYNNEHIPQRPVKKSRKKSKGRTAAFYDKDTASETSANSKTAGRRGKKKSSGKKPSRAKRIIRILLLAILAALLVAAVYAAVVIAKAPKIDPDNIYSFLNESSILYDDDGNQLYSIYSGDDGNRTNVEYTQIPENMINAIVSIEDKTFWTTVAAVGSMTIPLLVELGYDKKFCTALVAVAGSLGVIIPPSIPFIMYGMASGASVSDIFLAGIVPGILIGLLLMVYAVFYCKKKNSGKNPE